MLCTLADATNHGSVIQLVFKTVEGEKPIVVTGDHRPLWAFLVDWNAAGQPLVHVSDDRQTLLLDN